MNILIICFITLVKFGFSKNPENKYMIHPTPISDLNIKSSKGFSALMICISDDEKNAFVTSASAGVQIIDLSRIEIPKIVNTIPTQYAQHCDARKNFLFIADQKEGLIIVDVNNKQNPFRISTTAFTNNNQFNPSYQYVLISSDMEYAFTLSYGFLFTYSLNNLNDPQIVSVISNENIFSPNSYRIRKDSQNEYIAIANHIKGFSIIDIRNIQKQKLRVVQNPDFVTWDCQFTPDRKALFVLDAYSGLYYSDPSAIFSIDQTSDQIINLQFTQIVKPQDGLFLTIDITSDGNYLIIGCRSIGLKVYQLQKDNYPNPIFLQILKGQYIVLSMVLSRMNNKYLYISNGISATVYKAVQPNLNQDFPNFINTIQSSLIPQTKSNSRFGLKCLTQSIIVAGYEEIGIYDVTDPFYPKIISTIQRTQDPNDPLNLSKNYDLFANIETSYDQSVLYITSAKTGLITYDISNKAQPILKNKFILQIPNQNGDLQTYTQMTDVSISQTNDKLIASNSFYGLILFQIGQDLSNPQVFQLFQNNLSCGIQKCDFTSDGKKFACACREIGIVFYEIGAQGQLLKWNYIFNEICAEYVLISSNDQYLFAANGFQGIFILDITNFFQPKLLSQLLLQGGYAQNLKLLYNQKYLVVTEMEKNQLSLVNIEDLQNPYIQQRVTFPLEYSTNVCILPEKPEHMYFIESDESLLVGQEVYITFVTLYIQKHVQIKDAKYYKEFEKQTLPPWITFFQSKEQIYIQVNKLGAQNSKQTKNTGENILILEVYIENTPKDLEKQNLISPQLAQHLFKLLQLEGYLDEQGYITSKFEIQIYFELNFYNADFPQNDYQSLNQDIQNHIKKTLIFSRVDYPIRFFIKSSLQFNYSKSLKNQFYQNSAFDNQNQKLNVITTPSQQVSIFMQITTKNGKFIKKSYQGVLSSFSEDQTSLKISGQASYVNDIMKNSIKISNSTANLSEVKIFFLISDSNNYDISMEKSLKEIEIFNLYQPIRLNYRKTLQKQFNNYFTNGEIEIEQRFQFWFDRDTFISSENLQITYKAYILSGYIGKEIQIGQWIEFNSDSFVILPLLFYKNQLFYQKQGFQGSLSSSDFLLIVRIRVMAYDGYSETYDEFEMNFNKIPFIYVIQKVFSIIFPVLGFLGLLKYRQQIHLFLCEKKNKFQSEVAIVGQIYRKRIVLYGDIQKYAIKLWDTLNRQDKYLQKKLLVDYKLNKKVNIERILFQLEQIYQSTQQEFPYVDPREFTYKNSRMYSAIKRIVYESILNQFKESKKAYKLLKEYPLQKFGKNDWYKYYVIIQPNNNNNTEDQGQDYIIDNEDLESSKRSLNTQKQILDQDQVNEEGIPNKINFRITNVSLGKVECTQTNRATTDNDILKNNQCQQKPFLQIPSPFRLKEKQQLKLPYLQERVDRLYNIYNSTERESIQIPTSSIIYLNKDNVKNLETQFYNNLNPFPTVIIKKQVLDQTLKALNQVKNIDLELLENIIILDCYGSLCSNPNMFNPSSGESIHTYPYNLSVIQAYCKQRTSNLSSQLLRFLNMEYVKIGLSTNKPLPCWLQHKIVDGVLILEGTPPDNEETDILIRIVNQYGFVIFSYHIIIQTQEGSFIRDQVILQHLSRINTLKSRVY